MKSFILLLASAAMIISCKKETGGGSNNPKQILLSEVKTDGLLANRMEYNSDNLITKIEGYNPDHTDNTVQSYVTFQYEGKQIKRYTGYTMPSNTAVQKVEIEYDDAGKLVSAASYDLTGPTPNTASFTTLFYYNAAGLVNKSVNKNKEGKSTSQTLFMYYADGHLKERQGWQVAGDQLWMKSKYSYSIPNGYYPGGLEQIRVLVGSEFAAAMHSDAISYKTYDQSGYMTKEYSELFSARQYNEDGSLKQQVATFKYIKPEKDDESTISEYKYIIK